MGDLVLSRIVKKFNDNVAVEIDHLEIRKGEFIVLLGPSGCGKTTTLRLIAGLESPTRGEIILDGKVVNALSPKERNVAMVFQDYALYPHMRVYDNIALNLRVDKLPKDEIDRRVHEVARLLNIEHLLSRRPRAMSGGQQQRVALGRAIVRNPRLFLMDEPLSNLDAKLRLTMRSEIKKLHTRLGTTTIYVTHDQEEAMVLADRIVILAEGRVLQIGSPEDVYENPRNVFVARFIGSPEMNLVDCRVESTGGDTWLIGEGLRLRLPADVMTRVAGRGDLPARVVLGIRPRYVKVGRELEDADGVGEVTFFERLGEVNYVHVETGKTGAGMGRPGGASNGGVRDTAGAGVGADRPGTTVLVARWDEDREARAGERVELRLDRAHIQVFDAATGTSLVTGGSR